MAVQGTDEHGMPGNLKLDCETTRRLVVTNDPGIPLEVATQIGNPIEVEQEPGRLNLNPGANNFVTTVGVGALEYTLPTPGGKYLLIAEGGPVWIRETAAAVMHLTGMVVPDGVPIGPFRINGPTISCIAAAAGRTLYFVEVLD
jgi:hypothetical protein